MWSVVLLVILIQESINGMPVNNEMQRRDQYRRAIHSFSSDFHNKVSPSFGFSLQDSLVFHEKLKIENSDGLILSQDPCNGPARTRDRFNRIRDDGRRRFCNMFIHVDFDLFSFIGTEGEVVRLLATYVQGVNEIYRKVDFDGDGQPDQHTFVIEHIKIDTKGNISQPPLERQPINAQQVLDNFSEGEYRQFCLAFLFTFQRFMGGAVGLTNTLNSNYPGGVCERRSYGILKSLNTGLVSLLRTTRETLNINQVILTFAHELGHSLGAVEHDHHEDFLGRGCTPGDYKEEGGNYLMAKNPDHMYGENAKKFSTCSLEAIKREMPSRAMSRFGCFERSADAKCKATDYQIYMTLMHLLLRN